MAHTARGYCWTSKDDMVDNGYRREVKHVINTTRLPSKPSVDYNRMYRMANARNGYTVQCDLMMGLWRDGVDYMKAVKWACYWLERFNERNGSVFNA